jgi:hypothetical protein
MKTILNIFLMTTVILLIATAVAGGYTLIVNNSSLASSPGGEGGQPPAMTGTGDQTTGQPPARHEGGASAGMGLIQVLITLAKLAGIGAIVLLVEKGIDLIGKRRADSLA